MEFNISDRGLTTLEGVEFPEGVTELVCHNNQLQSLEHCPQGVTKLWCSHNQLQSLEHCPQGVKELDCSGNQLKTLKHCPQSVTKLRCIHNKLQTLKHCPQDVKVLWCFNNQLQTLEHCPYSVTDFWCYDNPLQPPWDYYLIDHLPSLHTFNRKLKASKWIAECVIVGRCRLPKHLKIEIADRYVQTLRNKFISDLNITET